MSEIYDYRKFDWFAWYPVRTENGRWVWCVTVECYTATAKPGYFADSYRQYWLKPVAERSTP